MVPESTLKELEKATVAAQYCLTCLVGVKSKIEDLRGEVASALLAETIREPACRLLESWRTLYVVLSPHAQRDFMAVCKEPVEIGEIFSVSAHRSAFDLSHQSLIYLSLVLMPAGYWPTSEDPETDCLLADFRSETPVEVSENTVRELWTGLEKLSLKELGKCIVLVTRECAAVRARLPPADKGEDAETSNSLVRCDTSPVGHRRIADHSR